jgi:hypothetical protein
VWKGFEHKAIHKKSLNSLIKNEKFVYYRSNSSSHAPKKRPNHF